MQTRCYNPFSGDVRKDVNNDVGVGTVTRGYVVDNNDPLNIGRIKVRINSIHGTAQTGMKDNDLPWALPSFNSASFDSGSFIVPEINNTVWIVFEDNSISQPVYIGGMYGAGKLTGSTIGSLSSIRSQTLNVKESPREALDIEKKIIYKSPKGAMFEIIESSGEESVYIRDQIGQHVLMKSPLESFNSVGKVLNGEASIEITTVDGSGINVNYSGEESLISVTCGDSVMTISSSHGIKISDSKYSIEVKDGISIQTDNESIQLSEGSIRLEAKVVTIKAEVINLGDD